MKTFLTSLKKSIIILFLISFYPSLGQINYNVFGRSTTLTPSAIFQISSGKVGIGYTGNQATSNINAQNAQLSIVNSLVTWAPQIGLNHSNSNYYIDYFFDSGTGILKFGSNSGSPDLSINNISGNVYIGSQEYSWPAKLYIDLKYNVDKRNRIAMYNKITTYSANDISYGYAAEIFGPAANESNAIHITNWNNSPPTSAFIVKGSGQTQIGAKRYTGSYGTPLLSVDGMIAAKEVIVNASDWWPDFVFEKNYCLMPLSDLENYIQKEKHLPGLPTAEMVKENGYSLNDLDRLLLQKIEELTLYTLELKNEIEKMKNIH